MPNTIQPKNQERFVQLLRGYLNKTGRKQVELARASNWSESMLSKVLKGKTPPNLGLFCTFQAPFLVAHGGVTQARQVDEMAQLLGSALDEAGLLNIAKAVERFKDPELDTIFFRDRAEEFRKTIPAALNRSQTDAVSAIERAELAETAPASQVADTRSASDDQGAQSAPEEQPSASAVMAAALADWQAVLRDLVPSVAADTLEPDEVIAAVLDWESRQTDQRLVAVAWDWFDSPATFEKFRQRARLDFMLKGHNGQVTWNQLEWQWLNHVLVETAQRQAGGSQLSPSQLAAFVVDLGRVAFEAVKADTGQASQLAVNLAELARRLPMAQVTSWNWLSHIAQSGLIRLSVSQDGNCQFASREEAEFLAAQYLIHAGADETLLGIARNCGRPFGVLSQVVRTLHFRGRDGAAGELIGALLKVSEDVPLRYADAAYLLAACEAPMSESLVLLWDQVVAQLCESWAEVRSRDYREYVARALRYQDCPDFVRLVRRTLHAELSSGDHNPTTLRSLALVGGSNAVDTLQSLGEAQWLVAETHAEQGQPWNPLSAVLAVVPELAPYDQVAVLENLALGEVDNGERWRVVQALADAGTIPAIRALDRIATGAADLTLARYAQTQRMALNSPSYAALVARELDAAMAGSEPGRLALRMNAATGLLARSPSVPSAIVSRSLAQVWAKLDLDDSARIGAALSLIAARASAALDICLSTLPLADAAGSPNAGLLARLLPALSSPAATPRLWPLVDHAASPAQRASLIFCLGRAGGMALDGRFERLVAGPSEPVAAAAIVALARSLGPAAASRLVQIAASDTRPDVRTAANEGLAEIGSEQALPYLREKLKDPTQHAGACMQLARLHHHEAEALLVQAVITVTDPLVRNHVYLPVLARSGGAIAVRALRDLLGPEPDKMLLRQVRADLSPDTVSRALDVWGRLANDTSPAWCMTAVEVILRDRSQALFAQLVRVAVEGTDPIVREYARKSLQLDIARITSPAAADYVLLQVEQQVARFGQPAKFLLEILQKCLSGLSTADQGLPPDLARRTLAILWPVLSNVRPTDECFVPLLAAFGYPEFRAAAGELERHLDSLTDAATAGQVLETLIAMQAPRLPDVLIRLAKSTRWPALQARASDYMAEVAEYAGLAQAPNELKYLAYRVAIRKGIRFRRDGLRHKVILPNGEAYVRPAQ